MTINKCNIAMDASNIANEKVVLTPWILPLCFGLLPIAVRLPMAVRDDAGQCRHLRALIRAGWCETCVPRAFRTGGDKSGPVWHFFRGYQLCRRRRIIRGACAKPELRIRSGRSEGLEPPFRMGLPDGRLWIWKSNRRDGGAPECQQPALCSADH